MGSTPASSSSSGEYKAELGWNDKDFLQLISVLALNWHTGYWAVVPHSWHHSPGRGGIISSLLPSSGLCDSRLHPAWCPKAFPKHFCL